MMKIKIFTFQEVLNLYPSRAPLNPHQSNLASDWFTKMLEDASLKVNVVGLDSAHFTSSVVNDVINALMTEVYNRHDEDYMFSILGECGDDIQLSTGDFKKAIKPILNVLELTLPRYTPILEQNKKYSVDPVAKITSKTTGDTRFNDTPQESGDFNDYNHSSNVSHSVSESEVDSGSIMTRLEEMFKNFRSIILDWSNEFNKLFEKEEQLS